MIESFAVIAEGASEPAAFFTDLEAAMDWGLHAHGSGHFRIRSCMLVLREPAQPACPAAA
jgi:hypothetical protein